MDFVSFLTNYSFSDPRSCITFSCHVHYCPLVCEFLSLSLFFIILSLEEYSFVSLNLSLMFSCWLDWGNINMDSCIFYHLIFFSIGLSFSVTLWHDPYRPLPLPLKKKKTLLFFLYKILQVYLLYSLTQLWNQPFLQLLFFSFIGGWYVETNIRVLGVLLGTGVSLLLVPLSGQLENTVCAHTPL